MYRAAKGRQPNRVFFSLSLSLRARWLDIENGGKGRLEEEEEERRWSETYVCLALAFKFRIFNAFSRSLSGLRGSSIRRFGALNNFRR